MDKQLVKDSFGWGFVLWFIGYVLGMVLFFIVPPAMIGWTITPIGIAITIWVLCKKVKADAYQRYVLIAIAWTLLAIIFDYLFLVKALNPADGYYKADVYLYYALTFVLPLMVGWYKNRKEQTL